MRAVVACASPREKNPPGVKWVKLSSDLGVAMDRKGQYEDAMVASFPAAAT
jgi:hypothetical protein